MAEVYIPGVHVLHLAPTWSKHIEVDPRQDAVCLVRPGTNNSLEATLRATIEGRMICLHFPVKPVLGEEFEKKLDGSMHCFGIRRIGPGTWKVVPSLNVPGALHAFLVLCDVPEPPPWENPQ